ncbi:ATP-binding cassette domain-containing protein [Chrysiogenes arsenatis]|uniref:ATP-binding cassette domain-containing protein n=1 Tax=Chrysiogenes arsenatis TaxID=309797 RepID=UPI0003F509ED|nr:ATP-binding cassette domain-containing protein [Chrysiogenes arsenatis]
MSLLSVQNVRMAYGGPTLLENVNLQIEPGERVCLIGRNGTGKSTLLQIIAGAIPPDSGEVVKQQGIRVAFMSQEVAPALTGTVYRVIADGLGEAGQLLARYQQVSLDIAHTPSESNLNILERLQQQIDAADGWVVQQQVEQVTSRLGIDPHTPFDSLSGGMKRRVLLARSLVSRPNLLVLDEPTNHLDIDSINWLEQFLCQQAPTLLFVTHDRMFLRRVATRIVELDRGEITNWECDYPTYLARKKAALDVEAEHNAQFDKKLNQEEAWIRQGIKARRTRNEGRVRQLEQLRLQRKARREQEGRVRLNIQTAERSGNIVVTGTAITHRFGDNLIIDNFSPLIMRGDRIGLIGPNGVGKTTLLQILLGQLLPDSGSIEHGTKLAIAYFDQMRDQLDPTKTVQENVSDGTDTLLINGQPKHIISYLQDFLFTPARARTPVSALSGGERNRLLLAKMFSKPSNVLVLDEPTNDLDSETLELLEEQLYEYQGTLLVVSHDREFLNNIVTSTLVFEGNGRIAEFVGGYDDWLRQKATLQSIPSQAQAPAVVAATKVKEVAATTHATTRLTYGEKIELEKLPALIETMETEKEALFATLGDPLFYQRAPNDVQLTNERYATLEQQISAAYARWDELESKSL